MKFFIWYFLVPNLFILCFSANIKGKQEFLSFLTINEKIEYEHPNEKFMLNLEEIPENEVLLITKKKNLERENKTVFLKDIPLKTGNESFAFNATNKNGFYLDHRYFIQETSINEKSIINESERNLHKPNEYKVFYLNDSKNNEKAIKNAKSEDNLLLNLTKIEQISENVTNLKSFSLSNLKNRLVFDITNTILNRTTKINNQTEIMILLLSKNNASEEINKTNIENVDEIEIGSKNQMENNISKDLENNKNSNNEKNQNLGNGFNSYNNNNYNDNFSISEKNNEENENYKYFDDEDEHLFDLYESNKREVKNSSENEKEKKLNYTQKINNSEIESNNSNISKFKIEKKFILNDDKKQNMSNNNNSSTYETNKKINELNNSKNNSLIIKKNSNFSLKNEAFTNLNLFKTIKNEVDPPISLYSESKSPIMNINESLLNESFSNNKPSDSESIKNSDEEFYHANMNLNAEVNETESGSKFLGDLINQINDTKVLPEKSILSFEGNESMDVSSVKDDEKTNYFNDLANNDNIFSIQENSKKKFLEQSDEKKLTEVKAKQANFSNQNISFKLLNSESEVEEMPSNETNYKGLYDSNNSKSFNNLTNDKKIISDINSSLLSSQSLVKNDNNSTQNIKSDTNEEFLPAETKENETIISSNNVSRSAIPIQYNESPKIIKSFNSFKNEEFPRETRNIVPNSQNIQFSQENSDKFIEVKKMTIPTSLAEKQGSFF